MADGVDIGIMEYGDAEAWKETVAGYTFENSNGNKFLIIKNDTLIEGIDAAYEKGVISADTLREFYEAYTGYREENPGIR